MNLEWLPLLYQGWSFHKNEKHEVLYTVHCLIILMHIMKNSVFSPALISEEVMYSSFKLNKEADLSFLLYVAMLLNW